MNLESRRFVARTMGMVAWSVFALTLASCGKKHEISVAGPGEDVFDVVHRARIEAGVVTARDSIALPIDAYTWWTQASPPADVPRPPRNKIHSRLQAQLVGLLPTDSVTVLVAYRDTMSIPRMPFATATTVADSVDSLMKVSATAIANSLLNLRAADYQADSAVVGALGGRVLRRYWLTHSLLMRLPAQSVNILAARPEVLFIRGERAGEGPPVSPCLDGTASITPCAGRSQIKSEPYLAGYGRGRIALLDTGVRTDHDLLAVYPPRLVLFDLVEGDAAGLGGNPGDACTGGHGTSSAALLTGGPGAPPPTAQNANIARPLPDEYRGVTTALVESYKVYAPCTDCTDCSELDAPAAKAAFGLAVIRGAPVITAEIAGSDPDDMVLIAEAENAYKAGRVVVAANGNVATMKSMVPAVSPSVIGVGAYDIRVPTAPPMANFSGGVTSDSILKPDLMAPTGTVTAGSQYANTFATFPGTSGATPYVAGAALMLWNLIRGDAASVDPGQVYAALVLATRGTRPFPEKAGAGAIQLPTNCWMLWGKVELSHGEQLPIALKVPPAYAFNPNSIRAAVWWPRKTGDPKRNVDLFLLDPSGQVATGAGASSTSEYTSFEWVGKEGGIAAGEWKLRVKATELVGGGKQVVYWAATLGMP